MGLRSFVEGGARSGGWATEILRMIIWALSEHAGAELGDTSRLQELCMDSFLTDRALHWWSFQTIWNTSC